MTHVVMTYVVQLVVLQLVSRVKEEEEVGVAKEVLVETKLLAGGLIHPRVIPNCNQTYGSSVSFCALMLNSPRLFQINTLF
jgi:hypothetical protein